MNKRMKLPLIFVFCASSAFAQTTQTGVLGPSDDPVFSERVSASDGVVYKCKPDIRNVDGQPVRECLREDDEEGGTIFGAGTAGGLALLPALGGIAVLGAIASDSDSGSSTATTSTD